ncbi:phage portal protein [Amorphus orientalis]|uniref:Lambda family phage portal protein n=1 Tax=Amorphus orientalis TaxID=649198 RepID=A0AAE3VNC3_9HYPH|nr:phage portal protein [Amorphus orientalis]MDQ0314841.1 lambda family phage portal protein [Amorphus orientalis]
MLRDTKSGILASRRVALPDHRSEVRRSWRAAAALAMDFIQNSGTLKGACDQVLVDTVGVELVLSPQPDLSKLGYDQKETDEWCSLVKKRWKRFAWNPHECDQRGKLTVPQMVDIGLRWYIAYGEITGMLSYMPRAMRRRYGITTGTKVLMTPPHRLMQDTIEAEGLYQGVWHDENGRPVAYKFRDRRGGIDVPAVYPAMDGQGRPIVLHIFDPADADDVRGISPLTPAFRRYAMSEVLDDSVLQSFVLQNIISVILTSPAPSADAFEGLEALGSSELKHEFAQYFGAMMDKAKDKISVGDDPRVVSLAPGEDLHFRTPATPGPDYLPFKAALSRETARAIGCTHASFSMDHSDATYSSTRMETASIWPIVLRRRERLAAPLCQVIYDAWLDEEIGEGRIPLKGGYSAFQAHRDEVCWAQWQGPAKPSADDYKSARASSERLSNGTSSIEIEAAELGIDPDELFEQRVAGHRRYVEAGMRSPYDRDAPAASPVDDEERKRTEAE